MRRIVTLGGALLLLIVLNVAHAQDASSANYQVLAPVITNGGGYATSTNFSVLGVISEFAHGTTTSLSFGSSLGFAAYPSVSTPAVSATAGDALVSLSWTASEGFSGWTVSGYDVGQSTTSGGPYTYSSVGNVTSSSRTGLTNGTAYYFVVNPKDAFGNRIATSTQVSATPVAAESTPSPAPSTSPSGGGGGGTVSSPVSAGATVTISGRAYPSSQVTVLKDGQIEIRTIAGPDAMFTASLTGLQAGAYNIAVYSEDKNGNRSTTFTFPVQVTAVATTNIGGIFLAPTISVDKSEVRRGDNIAIFGQSVPKSDITISIHSSQELFAKTTTDAQGAYLYTLDTTPLDTGDHMTKSKAAIKGEISSFGRAVSFVVGTQNVAAVQIKTVEKGDINGDNKVNLIDFSVAAYWYKRLSPPLAIDLNKDGMVDLIDFSIMAFYWTG